MKLQTSSTYRDSIITGNSVNFLTKVVDVLHKKKHSYTELNNYDIMIHDNAIIFKSLVSQESASPEIINSIIKDAVSTVCKELL